MVEIAIIGESSSSDSFVLLHKPWPSFLGMAVDTRLLPGSDMQEVIGTAIALFILSNGKWVLFPLCLLV